MNLRRTHPNFWVSVIADVVFFVGVGSAFCGSTEWVSTPAFEPFKAVMPMRAWGAGFIAVGVLVWTAKDRHWPTFQVALGMGMALIVFGVAAFVLQAARGENPQVSGIFAWSAVGLTLRAQLGEPPSNPLAAIGRG